ncbi:MAG: hypothetical protein U0X41_02290 [Chitinophagales bacterium]
MKIKLALPFGLTFLGIISCYKTPEYPIEPTLKFDSYSFVNPYEALTDASMYFTFTDGDGDLGKTSNNDTVNINSIIIRNIKNNLFDTANIPYIPKKGTTDAISGKIEVKIFNSVLKGGFIDQSDVLLLQKPYDTLTYEVFIKDRAGHVSNIVTTPPLIVHSN